MVEIEDIVDRGSLREWLDDQPREVSIWIARRAAMRLLPYYLVWAVAPKIESKANSATMSFLRFYLISEVSRKVPTAKVAAYAADAAAVTAPHPTPAPRAFPTAVTVDTAAAYAAVAAVNAAAVVNAAAADIAEFAAASVVGFSPVSSWKAIRADCGAIGTGRNMDGLELWIGRKHSVADVWQSVKKQLLITIPSHSSKITRGAVAVDWSFWIKWYDSVLAGEPLNGDMLKEIALIEPAEWEKGALHINNEVIAGIVEKYSDAPARTVNDRSITTKRVEIIRQTVGRNKAAVPAQLQGLLAIISDEMERLRSINVQDDIEAQNRDRQLGIFQNLADGIKALEDAVPSDAEPTTEDAEKIDGLLTVYANELRKWPRDNAADMVDSTVRVALVGMTAGLAVTFGAPVLAGVAVGGIAFGGKKLAGAAKSLKDSVGGG